MIDEALLPSQWRTLAEMWIPGKPRPQPRQKFRTIFQWKNTKAGPKKIPISSPYYSLDDETRDWKDRVILTGKKYRPENPIDSALRVDCIIMVPRPQSMMNKSWPSAPIPCPCKPDKDNYEKLILDALKLAAWFTDDGRVFDGRCRKFYTRKDAEPGAFIRISQPVVKEEPCLIPL